MTQHIAKNVEKQYLAAELEEFIWRLAKDCINRIQAAGGYGCTQEDIVTYVAQAMLKSDKKKDV